MEPTRANWRHIVAPAVGIVAAITLFAATPAAHAQSRFRVLVPALKAEGGAKENFGKDVADRLRKSLNDMATHAAVERNDLRTALRQYKLKEADLVDCVIARQFAIRIDAEVLVCGTYEPAASGMQVTATIVTARTGEAYDVPPFNAASPDEAAQTLFSGFETLVNQQRFGRFCIDYLASEQWTNALDQCNQALAINPNSQSALFGRGRALVGLDSLEQALVTLEKLLEINATHGDALQTAGYAATKLNQPQKALEYYRMYLELNPGSSQIRLTVATDLFNNGDPKGALQLTEEGIAVDSTDINLRLYAGHFALAAAQKIERDTGAQVPEGRPAEAVELYEKALGYYEGVFAVKGDSADATMLRSMMQTLVLLERGERAAELGGRIVRAMPDSAALWSVYADALQSVGRLDEALAALDSVLARDPEFERVYSRQVVWFTRAEQVDRIKQAFDKAVARQGREVEPDVLARNVLSYGYNEKFQKGDQQGALPYLELVREMNTTPITRGMASYFAGFVLLNRGIAVNKPETLQSARAALPIFQRAIQYFEDARPFAQSNNIKLDEPIQNAKDYIEIQEAIIKRGR